jgi:DNA repair protein RecN (Recombination protein N)
MLNELRVENLLLIERAHLELAGGLNVLTGETGAGKTVLAQALDLLLGGRAGSAAVRPGASEAYVEGVFELTDPLRERLGDRLPADAEELVLARRVAPGGRTRAHLNGRTVSIGDLRDLAGGLLTFYGQHEHRRLTLASAQLDILDAYCGPRQAERRSKLATAHARHRQLGERLAQLREAAGSRERELDLLRFELNEIEDAAPEPGEDEGLRTERDRLRSAEQLAAAALAGAEALAPDSGAGGASAQVAQGAQAIETVAHFDPRLGELGERLRSLLYEADDLGAELRRYGREVEAAPARLQEVEERLALLDRLTRKHGGTIEEVLAHADRCRARAAELDGGEAALDELTAQLATAQAELDELATSCTQARRRAAPRLAGAVRERLAELAMEGAGFDVGLELRSQRAASGDEAAEFQLAPNPGVPAGPLREIASGGELSRVMLALMGVAAEARNGATAGDPKEITHGPLLVFDEVDAGIGGHTARVVGERLRDLAGSHQVLCITHLPQVASLAQRHFRIVKDTGTRTARATVAQLHAGEVDGELVRMLGASDDDVAARRHARQLRRAA